MPHARILGLDATQALSLPGVVGFWSAKDVPGDPTIGPVFPDETCFAKDLVTCVGQVIGVLAATSQRGASRAARAVKVTTSHGLCCPHSSPCMLLVSVRM
jgi:xanthine dehydrogenase/oxidase